MDKNILVLAPHTDDGEFGCGGSIAKFLEDGDNVYYIAFSTAKKSVPEGLPQDILEKEESDDLRDRARIALLRIDPQSMDRAEKERPGSKGRILHLVVKSLKGKGTGFEIAIPWALADLALGAIPDEAKEDIRREGYNLDKIFRELNQFSGKVFEIRSEDSLIKIWIE